MPALRAFSTGSLNACRSISDTAMPEAPLATAVLSALTIWLTLLLSEPVHSYEVPSSLLASWMPYWVGVKKGLVVTWFTNTNLYSGCEPKTLAEPLLVEALLPQAARIVLTEPAAT